MTSCLQVFLFDQEPDAALVQLLEHEDYEQRVQYLFGSLMVQDDLRRARAEEASALLVSSRLVCSGVSVSASGALCGLRGVLEHAFGSFEWLSYGVWCSASGVLRAAMSSVLRIPGGGLIALKIGII